MRYRISIRGCVHPSVHPSVGPAVGPSVTHELKNVLAPFLTKFGIRKGLKQLSKTIWATYSSNSTNKSIIINNEYKYERERIYCPNSVRLVLKHLTTS